jgi:acyl-CoA synthetase (NDP forming)
VPRRSKALQQAHPERQLSEAHTRPLFSAYGIPVVAGGCAHAMKRRFARQLGFPVVLKIISPDLLHKSDVGGIVLNLADEAAVKPLMRT